jgi:acyl-CoA reductase-like NAD-dependent aldehyde dehydrogenase
VDAEGRRKDHRYKFYTTPLSSYVTCLAHLRLSVTQIPPIMQSSGSVPEMTLAQTKEAINAAGDAFKSWSKTTAKVGPATEHRFVDHLCPSQCAQHRHDLLMKLHGLMHQHRDDLGRIIVRFCVSPCARKMLRKACRRSRTARPWWKARERTITARHSSNGSVGHPFC